jgi:hypothetical protein
MKTLRGTDNRTGNKLFAAMTCMGQVVISGKMGAEGL